MTDVDGDRAVGEVVEYCRTQAGLLAGRVDTMGEEARTLLDEIDEGVADLRDRLADRPDGAPTAASPETGTTPETAGDGDDAAADLDSDIAEAETALEEKQALVEATETRMRLFQDLAVDYLELAETLLAEHDAGGVGADDAVRRVVAFEAERDAPAYFGERETLVETARRGAESGDAEE